MKDLIRTKIKECSLILCAVLVGTVIAGTVYMGVSYTESQRLEKLARLDRAADRIVGQLQNNQLPEASQGEDYLVYIIDEKEGALMVERKSSLDSAEDAQNWERYKSKLIYQMQKQKRGTVFYPLAQGWNFLQSKRAIRYDTVKEYGWIIAVETPLRPAINIFKEAYPRSTAWVLFTITAFGCACIYLAVNNRLNQIRKILANDYEKNFLSLTGESILDKIRSKPEPARPRDGSKKKDVPEPKAAQPSSDDIRMEFTAGPQTSDGPDTGIEPGQEEDTKKPMIAEAKSRPGETEQRSEIRPEPKEPQPDDAYNDLTINVENIKSPVLKKMLKELRGKG